MIPKAKLTKRYRKGDNDDRWFSQDGTIVVYPAYLPNPQGGRTPRVAHYCVQDSISGEFSTAVDLDRARGTVHHLLAKRASS